MSNKYIRSRDEYKIPKFKDDYDVSFIDMILIILQAYKFLIPIFLGISIMALCIMVVFRLFA